MPFVLILDDQEKVSRINSTHYKSNQTKKYHINYAQSKPRKTEMALAMVFTGNINFEVKKQSKIGKLKVCLH